MPSLNFQQQFKSDILALKKPHTIRAKRKRDIKPGDTLHLFTGLRTKKAVKFAICPSCPQIQDITIAYPPNDTPHVILQGKRLNRRETEELAQRDGFSTSADFFEFFRKPAEKENNEFHGELIWFGKIEVQ